MTNTKYNIYERIFIFVVRVIELIKYVPKTEPNRVIIAQLLRSATSVGANAQEADGVSSKKDFIHCFTTVRKEGKETFFWLKLIGATNNTIKPPNSSRNVPWRAYDKRAFEVAHDWL